MHTLHTFSKKSLNIILSILFLIIPLSYAWLYIPGIPVTLADIFPRLGGFERVKVIFFFILALAGFIAFLGAQKFTYQHLLILGIFSVWTLFSYVVNQDVNLYFWFGNGEKAHGWYLYLGLLLLGIILSSSSQVEKKKYLTISMISGLIVCLYALSQKLGLDPIQSLYSSRLDETRIFSTLGNPNYLAGYVLMLMPLTLLLTRSQRRLGGWFFALLVLVLFMTKSLFGIGVFVGYLVYLVLYRVIPLDQKTRHIRALGIVGICCLMSAYLVYKYGEQILEIQKIKGFIARYFLWETGIYTIFGDIRNTLFGYGPDGFLAVSEIFRRPELSVFEDPAFRIDRSHNVWIDFIIHFGVPVGGLIIYGIFSRWKNLTLSHKEVLVLFSVFFFFNIPVLVHFILLLQILTFLDKSKS